MHWGWCYEERLLIEKQCIPDLCSWWRDHLQKTGKKKKAKNQKKLGKSFASDLLSCKTEQLSLPKLHSKASPKTSTDKELIIFIITTTAFKSPSSIDFNLPDAFKRLFWLLCFQPFIHKYPDLSWLQWPFKVFSLHLPATEHTGKSAAQQPLTLSGGLIKRNDAFWIKRREYQLGVG